LLEHSIPFRQFFHTLLYYQTFFHNGCSHTVTTRRTALASQCSGSIHLGWEHLVWRHYLFPSPWQCAHIGDCMEPTDLILVQTESHWGWGWTIPMLVLKLPSTFCESQLCTRNNSFHVVLEYEKFQLYIAPGWTSFIIINSLLHYYERNCSWEIFLNSQVYTIFTWRQHKIPSENVANRPYGIMLCEFSTQAIGLDLKSPINYPSVSKT